MTNGFVGVRMLNCIKSVMKVDSVGNKKWKLPNGDFHREGDLPAIEWTDGSREWWINGFKHRENNKPAVILVSWYKAWFLNGKHHRTNGAAIEWSDGSKEWYLEGVQYSEEEYNEKVKDYKTETALENNSYSQGHKDGHSGLRWL